MPVVADLRGCVRDPAAFAHSGWTRCRRSRSRSRSRLRAGGAGARDWGSATATTDGSPRSVCLREPVGPAAGVNDTSKTDTELVGHTDGGDTEELNG